MMGPVAFAWRLRKWARGFWFPVLAFTALGGMTALLAWAFGPLVPDAPGLRIGADAIGDLLNILASSMLAVTTFSVSIMVTAFASAATGATPRATALLQADPRSRVVLSVFLGSFVYAIVGIVALRSGLYGVGGRVLMFGVTVIVIAVIVVSLMRWITHLADFGRLSDTLDRVEAATLAALKAARAAPCLGGACRTGPVPPGSVPVMARAVGYLAHVDMPALASCAEAADVHIHLDVRPGAFVHTATPMAWIPDDTQDPDLADRVARCFAIDRNRSFDQDPRFGVVTLTEIALRALSPAVNDPGTAIDVLGRQLRLLSQAGMTEAERKVPYPNVHVPPLDPAAVLQDGFGPIARDGAALFEVQSHLQTCLLALAGQAAAGYGAAAAAMADRALWHASQADLPGVELATLRQIAARTIALAEGAAGRG